MVFLIKLVHFGRYSFLFCAVCITREAALHVYSGYTMEYVFIKYTSNGIFKNIYKTEQTLVVVIFVRLDFASNIPHGEAFFDL